MNSSFCREPLMLHHVCEAACLLLALFHDPLSFNNLYSFVGVHPEDIVKFVARLFRPSSYKRKPVVDEFSASKL